ncbi:hypothetical protein CLV35_2566 [Motilibacter peucedani]|uniref:Uncharacterized protein n=1 Tax=Motilibacter peucedani TaxID=598650 RepID=A0A420XPF0_9ACTN|nr:hypothetical protein [Motilibacter peucedani]RKS74067.1 hypothetical protein CLV35_2566 [Motilibacter peucedani]
MRDNGLRGESFVALAELAPDLVDAVLVLLRDAGVPAYAETAGPEHGATTLDRLFVESGSAAAARALLEERLPRMRDDEGATVPADQAAELGADPTTDAGAGTADDVPAGDESEPSRRAAGEGAELPAVGVDDDVWAGIVASFRAPSADMSGRVLPPPAAPTGAEPVAGALLERPGTGPEPDERVAEFEVVDHDDHFEPEPPPPLPRITVVTALAWAAVLLMPALFLLALWLHIDVTGWLGLFGVSAFVGGFLVLVSRLGDGPDDWDDGAVV